MKLKGEWSSDTSYSVGDVVLFSDNRVYGLQKPCAAGITPLNTLYWGKVNQTLADAVRMILDMEGNDLQLEDDLNQTTAGKKALDAHQGYVIKGLIDTVDAKVPLNISDDAIVLKDGEDNEYVITVDASGETPELVVTLIEQEDETEEEGET